jgi:transposase, IS6 family
VASPSSCAWDGSGRCTASRPLLRRFACSWSRASDQPLLAPDRIGTEAAGPYPPAIAATRKADPLARAPLHYVTKHLQQGIESDHFRLKKNMARISGFRSFSTARRTIQGFEAMLWLRKGFGFAGAWTVCEQNRLLAVCFGLQAVNEV